MNHDHDRSRSLFPRSRPLLIYELTFGVRAGSGGPRLRPHDFPQADSRARTWGIGALSFDLRTSKCSFPCPHAPSAQSYRTSSSLPSPHRRLQLHIRAPGGLHTTMTAAFGKKTKGCFSSKARFSAVIDAFCSSIANPHCLSRTRGLSSAACRVLLRRTRLRRFTSRG